MTSYNTAAMAADLNALRHALDYDEWNLYDESFSTRLMLLTMQARIPRVYAAQCWTL